MHDFNLVFLLLLKYKIRLLILPDNFAANTLLPLLNFRRHKLNNLAFCFENVSSSHVLPQVKVLHTSSLKKLKKKHDQHYKV